MVLLRVDGLTFKIERSSHLNHILVFPYEYVGMLLEHCRVLILVRGYSSEFDGYGMYGKHIFNMFILMMKVVNIAYAMINLQFKLPQTLRSQGFTRRTVLLYD